MVKCPVLYIRGDQESRENYPAEEFKASAGGSCDVEIVADCGHFYDGREARIQSLVSAWLSKTLNLPRRDMRS
jgi:alpha/beta superfamily hydrolase